MALIWLIAIILLALLEMSTMALVSIWFIFGAVAAMLASLMGMDLLAQLMIFVAVSTLLLILTRPLVKKFLQTRRVRTNADRTIGEKAVVIEEINNIAARGQVKIFGQIWSARSADEGVIIPEGRVVEVTAISGNKLIVKMVD